MHSGKYAEQRVFLSDGGFIDDCKSAIVLNSQMSSSHPVRPVFNVRDVKTQQSGSGLFGDSYPRKIKRQISFILHTEISIMFIHLAFNFFFAESVIIIISSKIIVN